MIIHNPAVRRYIYIVAAAVIAVLVLLGFVVEDHVQVWLNLVAALLGLPVAGLAAPNTPKETVPATRESESVFNVYTNLTPGDHVIQADVAPTYDTHLKPEETIAKPHIGDLDNKPTGETPPRTE